MASYSPIISVDQAANLLKDKPTEVKVLDASWFMPNSPRDPKAEFLAKHLPGAQRLDLDEVASTHELGLKHMMPSGKVFADACEKWGISPNTHVVLYDTHGVFSSPRALFTFRSFGHANSTVLDGGLPAWLDSGFAVEDGEPVKPQKTDYPTPQLSPTAIKDYSAMVENSARESDADIVLDARSRSRFDGTDPEPRPGLSSGHMPNSFSLPFNAFLASRTARDGSSYTVLKPVPEIREALANAVGEQRLEAILKGDAPVTTTCGSGMTAAILWLGLSLLKAERVSLYDESWTGYAMRASSVIQKSTN
ncbi:Rhodanese-like protein [Cylindrobasidium torrendii FP15055 ss-10]|uniref:Rhodanese-like protein n=1 Tax=Cylindrobasidium torrendii FP15055 ss-10 TaxID=1314674 RepID=A0A0D7AZB1_9AGAR|nr:Rhodanese-like protein [Cylindrobasidium torrendii FP15055 ss-10]